MAPQGLLVWCLENRGTGCFGCPWGDTTSASVHVPPLPHALQVIQLQHDTHAVAQSQLQTRHRQSTSLHLWPGRELKSAWCLSLKAPVHATVPRLLSDLCRADHDSSSWCNLLGGMFCPFIHWAAPSRVVFDTDVGLILAVQGKPLCDNMQEWLLSRWVYH